MQDTDKDKELWIQLFQDKPISSTALEHFQTQLMTRIAAHPVDFGEEKRIVERRKWGVGLAVSLMVAGLFFAVFLYSGRNIVFQGMNVLLVMLSGLSYVAYLQPIAHQIVAALSLLRELETGLSLLWGVVSWPMLGVLSAYVIFRSTNQVHNEKSAI